MQRQVIIFIRGGGRKPGAIGKNAARFRPAGASFGTAGCSRVQNRDVAFVICTLRRGRMMKNETMSAAAGSTLCAVAGLLAMLLVAAAGAGATERLRPMATGQPTAARRAADALLPPLHAGIPDGVWIEGTGVLMTPRR